MIPFEDARRMLESVIYIPDSEAVPLPEALYRVLAEEVTSDTDMPPFDKAAMDGYACRRSDLGRELSVIEEIPAGKVPAKSIGVDQCARIMTGAMMPPGADHVFMQEFAELRAPDRVYCILPGNQSNICYRGEDVRSGDLVLKRGTTLLAPQMAILAAAGCTTPRVYKKPAVAVLSTGDELMEPENFPEQGKIRNSNGQQLVSQVMQCGLHADYLGIIPDNRQALIKILADALEKYGLILVSGGVSVGSYDFVPVAASDLQMELLIHGMNVKPGRHLLFGRKGNHFIAGMPGNPVSSFVLFEMLVKPFLKRLMGSTEQPLSLSIPLGMDYVRKSSEMMFFIPVRITGEGTALLPEYHGSAHINAYAEANGIMEVPAGINKLEKGEIVHVRPI